MRILEKNFFNHVDYNKKYDIDIQDSGLVDRFGQKNFDKKSLRRLENHFYFYY